MKSLEEYSTENKPSDKPPHALDNYDVEAIVRDMYNEYPWFNKLDMVYEVMKFSRGRINPSNILKAFNKIKGS
jgi:hypothetical protein